MDDLLLREGRGKRLAEDGGVHGGHARATVCRCITRDNRFGVEKLCSRTYHGVLKVRLVR